MTTEPAALRLQDNSLFSIGTSLVAIVVAGFVCHLAKFDQYQTSAIIALAAGIPTAVEFQIKSRRRDTSVDIARIQRGELRRPVVLVVMLLATAIVLLDSVFGAMMSAPAQVVKLLIDGGKANESTAIVAGGFSADTQFIFGMCIFLVASYASHYFAKRPYLWTAAAIGCALAIRLVVVLALERTSGVKSFANSLGSFAGVVMAIFIAYLGALFISLVGVWVGRRYHNEFLAKKAARMEGKAAKKRAVQDQSAVQSEITATQSSAQDSNDSQNSAAELVTLIGRPDGLPCAPDNSRISDPIKQIEELANLRDTGALTEDEFQAKKTEILCRI